MSTFGLVDSSNHNQVPLRRIDVKAFIQGFIASVETKLVYENGSDKPIEASFTFPIDDSSAVYKFEVLINDTLIVGECQDKEQARQTYDDAIAAGDSAFLMEEKGDTGDIFECTVGNLPAKTKAIVTFTYVTQCNVTGNMASFVYPCVLAPRYTPADTISSAPTSRPIALKWKSVPVEELPYTATAVIYVRCTAPQSIQKLEANLEKKTNLLHRHVEKHEATLNFGEGMRLDEDLIVDVTYKDIFKPSCYAELGDPTRFGILGSDIMMVQFKPELDKGSTVVDTRGEYIFILDRSASMHGDRILNATKSLVKCLELLPEDCYFNVISFGSSVQKIFARSMKLTKERRQTAKSQVKAMGANLGATEMMKPFEAIYQQPCKPNYPKQLILLTDGDYYPLDPLTKLVKDNSANARVFTMGIGFGASTALVRTLARVGRGRCEFLREDMHKLEKQVETLLSCAMSPKMMSVGITWQSPQSIPGMLIPKELPPVFLGQTLMAYILLVSKDGLTDGSGKKTKPIPRVKELKVTLSGVVKNKTVTLTTDFKENVFVDEFKSDMPIHRMAAKAHIKELQGDEEYSGQNKNKIIVASISANTMSRYTSFVAVDTRKDKIKEKADHVEIPVANRKASYKTTPAPPTSYGGGSHNSMQVHKYLNGKTPDIPMASQSKGNPCGTIPCTIKAHVDDTGIDITVLRSVIEGFESESNISESKTGVTESETEVAESETEVTESETDISKKKNLETPADVEQQNVRPQALKRKRNGVKFTVSKKKKRLNVANTVFALWRDGYYYPGVAIETKGNRQKLRFKDNQTKVYNRNELIESCKLSPVDVVSVHAGKQQYIWAIVLEYTADRDAYRVALGDGKIIICMVQDMVLPQDTATAMKARHQYDPQAKTLVSKSNTSGGSIQVTTSDLSELRADGWINANIVAFYVREILLRDLPKILKQEVVVFERDLTQLITQDGRTEIRTSRYSPVKIDAVRPYVEDADLSQKKMFFFPVFDEVHWFVIVAQIETVPFGNNRFRGEFYTMDSYFQRTREDETKVLRKLLIQLFSEQGLKLDIECGAKSLNVPAQLNECDCGLYMLLNIKTALREEKLQLHPHLNWFTQPDALKMRRDIAKHILDCSHVV